MMSDHLIPHEHEAHASQLELEQGDVYSKYLLYSRSEIVYVLRAVLQKGSMITVYFDHGESFLLTALLAVDGESGTLTFDMGSDEDMNRKALKADRLLFTTSLDKVKVQFSLNGLSASQFQGRDALTGGIPEALLRLQRREYYRLSTPVANPIRCRMTIRRPEGSATVSLPLLDISGGGIGLMLDPGLEEDFPLGAEFAECRIDLPDEGLLVCNLIVRNAFEVTTRGGGHHYRRVGCEFVDLPGTRLTMIQRYITRIERERKARMSGMG
jgi:c-di-GMP-binding flagellar brake protein YcgR